MKHILASVETIDYPGNTFDGLFCDPPYGWSFMGRTWDSDVPSVEIWQEILRVLKPGAFGLVFCGARTSHIMGTNLAEAGFEIRDKLFYLYGSGFPKSMSIGLAIDKAAGAEREVKHRHIQSRTNPDIHAGYNVGSDSLVNSWDITAPATDAAKVWDGYGTALKPAVEEVFLVQKPREGTYVENILKWGCGGLNIDGGRIGSDITKTVGYNKQNGEGSFAGSWAVGEYQGNTHAGRFPANLILDKSAGEMLDEQTGELSSRFFYCSKVSLAERAAGVTERNTHTTLKPIDLNRYLATLIIPPESRKLLVPFAGAGSEMIGAHLAGWTDIVGIERDAEYHEIQKQRCKWWIANGQAEMKAAEIIKNATERENEATEGQTFLA
ncbi:MAG: hypothetical protein GY832_30845 [Chloroflexi bacterium]|nr:hypothetical protein [Chloroflexota bacterium]